MSFGVEMIDPAILALARLLRVAERAIDEPVQYALANHPCSGIDDGFAVLQLLSVTGFIPGDTLGLDHLLSRSLLRELPEIRDTEDGLGAGEGFLKGCYIVEICFDDRYAQSSEFFCGRRVRVARDATNLPIGESGESAGNRATL